MARHISFSTWLLRLAHGFLRAVPITAFTMALATDIAYVRTSNLLWLHFSEWLLLVGIVGVGFDLLLSLIELPVRKLRPAWPAVLMGVVIFVLAFINNLVHTADGWTAVVPMGLTLSAATVLAMLLTAWLGREGEIHA
ncbi:DUF2231 domain-containing protein [Devosia aurantiaca]|uniref:DUF2231 domain-containing protein n=1 Tax=Devosia aurantiaca TaxID=2714858 RepID=A0A6M1SVQ4_9HYPH|nr:DUF2231 domain-containing protein [Devosia aurantiaca]NGP18463.1 hypothetical protein [Devosia aurantiaca]